MTTPALQQGPKWSSKKSGKPLEITWRLPTKGLGLRNLKKQQQDRKFRNPDALGNPAGELFRLTNNVYDKMAGSRAIAPFLNVETNCSRSFNTLVSGIRKLAEI